MKLRYINANGIKHPLLIEDTTCDDLQSKGIYEKCRPCSLRIYPALDIILPIIVEPIINFIKKHKSLLSILLTIGFYGFAGIWIYGRREYFSFSFEFDWACLLVILIIALVLNLIVQPIRFAWLLEKLSVKMSFSRAVRDRFVLTSVKAVMPLRIGDPLGFYLVTRKWDVGLEETTVVWATEKFLSFSINCFILLVFLLLTFLSLPLSLLAAMSLLVLYLAWILVAHGKAGGGRPSGRLVRWAGEAIMLKGYSPAKKLLLIAGTLSIEALEILVLFLLLSQALEGGWADIDPVRVMAVHFSGMVPTVFSGAGSREAATLLVFSGLGDDRALFLAAFMMTLLIRVFPALPGMLLFLPATRKEKKPG